MRLKIFHPEIVVASLRDQLTTGKTSTSY